MHTRFFSKRYYSILSYVVVTKDHTYYLNNLLLRPVSGFKKYVEGICISRPPTLAPNLYLPALTPNLYLPAQPGVSYQPCLPNLYLLALVYDLYAHKLLS